MARWIIWLVVQRLKLVALRTAHELLLLRLRLESWRAAAFRGKPVASPRIIASACWTFPIYSQTFVHQEVLALARAAFPVRFLYAHAGPREELAHASGDLWALRRRILLHARLGALDLARFRRRMPGKVEALTELVASASGLSREDVERHEHFLWAFSFARAAEAWGADYLHSYFFYEWTLGSLVASYLLDIPRGVSCYADHLLQDYPLKVVPLHLRTCDVIVATSQRIRSELETIHGGPLPRVVVKPNAIDTSSFPPRRHGARAGEARLRLVCVNRIDPKKGLEYLVDAVRALLDRGVAVEAHIVGGPTAHLSESVEYEKALRAQVTRLGLDEAVRFAGQRNSREVHAFLREADIVVAPAVELPNGDKDGIPTAVLEAMAAGCAIVATNAGSIGEVIEDGREGLIVPQRDAMAIAAAIERLARDEELAARLGSGAASRARRELDIATSETVFHDRVRTAIRERHRAPVEAAVRP